MAQTNPQVVSNILDGRAADGGGAVGRIYDILEAPFMALGLYDPARRFLFTSVLVGGMMYLIKPGFAFTGDKARPWAITNPQAQNKTTMPWWMPAAFAGFGAGFLI